MVCKKRLSYEFSGFHAANVPRAPRSSRSRGVQKRTVEDDQINAFELLASLAGKLLQESESSASSNASEGNDHSVIGKNVVKQEIQYENKPLKMECLDQVSCEVSAFASESIAESTNDMKEIQHADQGNASCHLSSMIGGTSKVDGIFPIVGDSRNVKLEKSAVKQEGQPKGLKAETLTTTNTISKDSMGTRAKFPDFFKSGRDVKLPSRKDFVPRASFSRLRNARLGITDDDDKFTRLNKFSNRFKASSRPPTRIGDRRIRKLLTSRNWKHAPKLRDYEVSRADGGMKPLYRKRKPFYNHDKFQYGMLYKKRKLCDWQSAVTSSDGGFSSESVSNSPEKVMIGDKTNSAPMLHGVNGTSSAQQVAHHSKDSHVKFSIKSFKVPELFVEVPENATVGSLKRTIMEAVTALLGGGLRVGVHLQGKKVRDDSRTLSQSGISCKDNLDTLGFTLEPSNVQTPLPLCSEDPQVPLLQNVTENLTRSAIVPSADSGISDAAPDPISLTNSKTNVDSNPEPDFSDIDKLTDPNAPESKALVPVPPIDGEPLSVVPLNQKPRKSELAQRRTRRPFSVTEVEALVSSVEDLGTGRWRDVKLRSFENADHRTYVDLKDKWKTLVHTARISPQQRRGEPVPQHLLDRVLAAHAYWSQNQAKQQGKSQSGVLKLTDSESGGSNGDGAVRACYDVKMEEVKG